MQCLPVSVSSRIGLLFLYVALSCSDVQSCTQYLILSIRWHNDWMSYFSGGDGPTQQQEPQTPDTNGVRFCIPALTDLNCEYMQAHDSYTEKQKTIVYEIINRAGQCHLVVWNPISSYILSSCQCLCSLHAMCLEQFMSFLLHSTCTAHTFLEIRVVTVHTIKACGSGGVSPLILNFSTIFTSCFTHSRKSHWSILERRIGCLHRQSGCPAEETNFCPPEN